MWKAGFSRWSNRKKRDKRPGKGRIKGFTLFYIPPCPTLSGPALGENVNEIPSSFFHFSVSFS